MKAGIMQPYLFPYIGYFQLVKAVDTFVIYDDVQYITRGWINRNRILQNGEPNMYTFSLQNDSSRKNINERYFTPNFSSQCSKFLKILQFAYGNAPYFEQTKAMISQVFYKMKPENTDENIAVKIGRSIEVISCYLGIDTTFIFSSAIEKNNTKTGQQKVLELNIILKSDTYINPVGGRKLYDHQKFEEKNKKLRFLKPQKVSYPQFSKEFIPWLSIIDVCMFNESEKIGALLNSYSLVK